MGDVNLFPSGLLVPLVVSMFTNSFDHKLGWQITFFFTAGMCLVALLLWKVFIDSEVVPILNTPVGGSDKSEEDDLKGASLLKDNR